MRTTPIILAALLLTTPAAHAAPEGAVAVEDGAWARYKVLLQGAWADEPARQETSDLVVEWLEGPPMRDRDGRLLPVLHAIWQGPELRLAELDWQAGTGERHYAPEGGLLAVGRSRTVETTDVAPLGAYAGSERQQTDTYTRTYIEPGTRDCMLRPEVWQVQQVRCLIPGLEDLGLAGRPSLQRVPTGLHIWSDGPVARIDVQYNDTIAYATELEVRFASPQGIARAVLTLVDWEGVPAMPAPTGAAALEPLRARAVHDVLLDDTLAKHPFPLSEAVRLLHEEDSVGNDGDDDRDFHEWYAGAGKAYVFYAAARQVRAGSGAADHEWTLGWTDGSGSIFVRAVRDGDPPGLLAQTLGDDNTTFAVIDAPGGITGAQVHRLQLPDRTPIVSHMMEWWKEYAGPGRNDTSPDAWGYEVQCDDACRRPVLRIWVGQHVTRTGPGQPGVVASSSEAETDMSALFVTVDGKVDSYQETGRRVVATQRLGPDLGVASAPSAVSAPPPEAPAVGGPAGAASGPAPSDGGGARDTPTPAAGWFLLGLVGCAGMFGRRSGQLL